MTDEDLFKRSAAAIHAKPVELVEKITHHKTWRTCVCARCPSLRILVDRIEMLEKQLAEEVEEHMRHHRAEDAKRSAGRE